MEFIRGMKAWMMFNYKHENENNIFDDNAMLISTNPNSLR
jgi:hypothetical protein